MGLPSLTNEIAKAVGENTLAVGLDDRPPTGVPITYLEDGNGCSVSARGVGGPSVSETDGVRRVSGSKSTYYTIDAGVDFKDWHRNNETSWFSRLFE